MSAATHGVVQHGVVWELVEPGRPLVRVEREFAPPPPGHLLLSVIGCGVCHTDLGFADGVVRPKAPLPLVLGHEIVGRVIAAAPGFEAALGRRVLAASVAPCGSCWMCKRGRPTACPHGIMPGNDVHGGFATHAYVPAPTVAFLDVQRTPDDPPLGRAELLAWKIAPIADAGTTAWQAIVRAELAANDVAIFIGAGGVGGYGVQLARSVGAFTVAVDVHAQRLAMLEGIAHVCVNASGLNAREVRRRVRETLQAKGISRVPVRVFETSGTVAGQETAFELLDRGGSLSIVGFTPEKVPGVRLSNVMALDADLHGNWGCDPALYGEVIERVLSGEVQVGAFVQARPLDDVNEVLAQMRAHALEKRVVLIPN